LASAGYAAADYVCWQQSAEPDQPGACMRVRDTGRLYVVLLQPGGPDTASRPAQGLLHRPDWAEAARLPLCQVPGGSGNALAANCGLWSPATAAHAICKVRAPAPRSAPSACAPLLPGGTRHVHGACRRHPVQMPVSICLFVCALGAWHARSAGSLLSDPAHAWRLARALCVSAQGRRRALDIVSVMQPPGRRYFAFLSIVFGMVANLDRGTEHLRRAPG